MSARRTAATLAALALTAGLVAAPQTPAGAAGDSCISKKEYGKIKQGMTRPKVEQITGTNGKSEGRTEAAEGYIIEKRLYRVCTSRKGSAELGYVSVQGGKYKLTRKTVEWH